MNKHLLVCFLLILIGISITACQAETALPESSSGGSIPERINIPIEPDYSIKGWNQLLPFDGIMPVYDPQFISPEEAELQGSELVMGVF
jgi:hypothetical protein